MLPLLAVSTSCHELAEASTWILCTHCRLSGVLMIPRRMHHCRPQRLLVMAVGVRVQIWWSL
jgi:hypothetical protein